MTTNKVQDNFSLTSLFSGGIEYPAILHEDEVWMTQHQVGALLGLDRRTMSYHALRLIDEINAANLIGNVKCNNACKPHGSDQEVHSLSFPVAGNIRNPWKVAYSSDLVIEIAFAVRESAKARAYRKEVKRVLREYRVTGVAVNQAKVQKYGLTAAGEKAVTAARSTAASVNRRVRDVFALCPDYCSDTSSMTTSELREQVLIFQEINIAFCYLVTGLHPLEVIRKRLNGERKNAGLVNFPSKGEVYRRGNKKAGIKKGDAKRPTTSDMQVALNYLDKEELEGMVQVIDRMVLGMEFMGGSMTMREMLTRVISYLDRTQANGFSFPTHPGMNRAAVNKYVEKVRRSYISFNKK